MERTKEYGGPVAKQLELPVKNVNDAMRTVRSELDNHHLEV